MKIPIPDDWDGNTWQCVKLEFPASDKWLALLNGMLSQWRRGRLWDEDTGTVLDAVAVGTEIWERNSALLGCGECEECEECPTCPPAESCGLSGGGGLDWGEEDDMACKGIADLIKIEDGKLWAKNDCCEWEEVGTLERQTEPIPDDPLNPDHDPGVTYSACGKAYAGAEILFSVAENLWDESDNLPWQWINHVESGVGLDLDNKWIIAGVNQAIIMQGVGFVKSLIINEPDKAWVRCQLYQMFDAVPEGATEEQFNEIRSAIKSHAGFNPFVMNFWDYVFFALGWKDFRDVTALNSTDITRDCTCVVTFTDPTPDWTGVTWSHYWNFTIDDYTAVPGNVLTEWVAGKGFVDWADVSTRYVKTGVDIPFVTEAGTITHVWARIHVGTGFDWSGDTFKMQTDAATVAGPAAVNGDPVTAGGDITIDSAASRVLGATDNHFTVVMEGHVNSPIEGATDPDSPRLLALAIGGTGTDPFA